MMRKSWFILSLCLAALVCLYQMIGVPLQLKFFTDSQKVRYKTMTAPRSLASAPTEKKVYDSEESNLNVKPEKISLPSIISTQQASKSMQKKIVGSPGASLEDYLNSRSIKGEWHALRNEKGHAFKMTGGEIPGLLSNPKDLLEFMSNLENHLALDSGHTLYPKIKSQGGRVEQIDFMQKVKNHLGQEFEVVDGWIRILGNKKTGNIFHIQNEMKRIEPEVDLIPSLTEHEAMSIAEAYLDAPRLKPSIIRQVYLYNGKQPSQLIFKITAQSAKGSRILYVGHQTKSVVFESPTSFH